MRSRLPGRIGRALTRPAAMVAVIVGALAVVLALVLALGVATSRNQLPAPGVATSATPRVERLLSYTPERIAADLAVEQVYLTDDYREQYVGMVSDTLAPQALRENVSVSAEVIATGVVDATPRTMVVLMVAELTTTRGSSSGEPSAGRFRVTLEQVAGEWLISGLDVI